MSIKTVNSEIEVSFGKTAEIATIISRNDETGKPFLALLPMKKGAKVEIGSDTFSEGDIKDNGTIVKFAFASPKSIDIMITQLKRLKMILIDDYSARVSEEANKTIHAFIEGK